MTKLLAESHQSPTNMDTLLHIFRHGLVTALTAVISLLFVFGCGKQERSVHPSGTLEATEVDISPVLSGRVLRVTANLGDKVTSGDTLVVIDTELLALQRAQTESNRKTIAAQKRVSQSSLEQARTNLELLETTFSRIQTLAEQGTATRQQLDEATTKRDVAAEQVRGVRNQIAALDAEDEKLSASLAVIDRQLRDGVVMAPASGTVIMRAVEPGETVTPGAVMMRMADLSSLELRVFLGEQELTQVKLGQALSVLVDALPNQTLEGTVSWVSSEAEFTPKNAQTKVARTQLVYAVKLRVQNPNGLLHAGMPAEVKL